MRTVALATCRELPHLDADEEHLVKALRERGIEPHILPWDGGDDAFLAHPLTVIRSTWDYTARVDEFVAWGARLEARGARLENKASVVRWNTHKRYLKELERAGVRIVPTVLVENGAPLELARTMAERGWSRAVVKPAVSAGSKDTFVVDDPARAGGWGVEAPDHLVQPFLDDVARGELSLIYLDGAFSHAVNKVPRAGDFRSQPEFGSVVTRVEPSPADRAAADDIVRTVGGNLLYARVDLVGGLLMELELVEPSLYFAWAPEAAATLAAAIARRMP